MHGDFIFADLSTYTLTETKDFYEKVFDWKYYSDDQSYFVGYKGDHEVAGLYETPEKFKEIWMPSFWMTYIQVEDRDKAVQIAIEQWGKVEVKENISPSEKVALIRDPLGAGFTIYEGSNLQSRTKNTLGTMVWNELYISDISKVEWFYKNLFGREISNVSTKRKEIRSNGEFIWVIEELEEQFRSKYQYRGVYFAVKSITEVVGKVEEQWWMLLYQNEGLASCTDPSWEAFFYLQQV